GNLQFEVFQRRLQDEYNAKSSITPLPYGSCRWVKKEDMPNMPSSTNQIFDRDGRMAVLFESDWELNYFKKNNPDIELLDAPEI
ncbi:MAG TPA: peptide chain release factor 3, partial [Leptospiraceae bacterium]|nr:peptide chain release factor 3 [Leptospiraceae bacterium]